MVKQGDGPESFSEVERLAQQGEGTGEAWQDTVRDMRVTAAERADEGYETLTIPAGNTAPVAPGSGDSDRFGFIHVIPGDKTSEFKDLSEGGEFSETDVYQARIGGNVFIVTECRDPDSGIAIFIAGVYQVRQAPALVRAATKRDEMYTHVKQLDGTFLGSFHHDDVSAFFPDPDEFLAFERNY